MNYAKNLGFLLHVCTVLAKEGRVFLLENNIATVLSLHESAALFASHAGLEAAILDLLLQ